MKTLKKVLYSVVMVTDTNITFHKLDNIKEKADKYAKGVFAEANKFYNRIAGTRIFMLQRNSTVPVYPQDKESYRYTLIAVKYDDNRKNNIWYNLFEI